MNNIWSKCRDRVSPAEFNIIKDMPSSDWKLLEELFDNKIRNYMSFIKGNESSLQYNKPIVVMGDKNELIKVKGYFFLKLHTQPRHKVFTIKDIVNLNEGKSDDRESDMNSFTFTDCPGLAVLYLDKYLNDYGRLEGWNDSCILSKVTERSRKENLTLVLSEVCLESRIKDNSEFICVNLSTEAKKLAIVKEKIEKSEDFER